MKKSIATFDELYFSAVNKDSLISTVISGHLMVEFMLSKVIETKFPKLGEYAKSVSHSNLIKLSLGLELISDGQSKVLFMLNSFRNRFAHSLTYKPTVAELRGVFIDAQRHFVDLTDGIITGIEELDTITSIDDFEDSSLSELFVQITYDLHSIYVQNGGDEIEFKSNRNKV